MQIRQYVSGDSREVRNLILSILKDEYPFDQNAYSDTDINDISGTYSGEGSKFFVATDDNGRVVGTVGVKKDSQSGALLRRLFVIEKFRKKGIGTNLVREALDFCKSRKYRSVSFRATDRMKDAIKVCLKMGFTEKENLEVSGFHIHSLVARL